MASMNDLRTLLPEQAAVAKFYNHGTDEVAEWDDGPFTFTVTFYQGEDQCWDVFLCYDEGSFCRDYSFLHNNLADALRFVVAAMDFELREEIIRREVEVVKLRSLADTIIERSAP